MAHLFKKYEFDTQAQAEEKIAALPHKEDEEGNLHPAHNHTIVKLGNIVTVEGTYSEDFEEITAPQYSEKYSVDVLWIGLEEVPEGWAAFEITCEDNGVHTFAGLDFNG